ncbi:MAG: hypothetical protein ABJQ78_13800 [Alloalcanivorax sp.]
MQLPYYNSLKDKAPGKYLSLAGVVDMARSPSVGPKSDTAALTPFMAQGKTQSAAVEAEFHALIVDHDDDNKTAAEIRDLYDSYGVAYLAYTTSSHQQDKGGVTANRWKVILPLANPVGHEQYAPLAMGLSLHHGADPAQARAQQVFYAPNKLSPGAPYDAIDATDRPLLDASDTGNPLVVGALSAYRQEQERKERQAKQAPVKPRTVSATSAGIIGKVCQQFDIESELLRNGYRRVGNKYLSPQSSTGEHGVHIFTTDDGTERLYSHHGETDPLSNLNHGGHSLDVFDVLVTLDYAGDVSRTVADLAPKVDPEGQQQRQREYMAEKDAGKQPAPTPPPVAASEAVFTLPDYPTDLMALPYKLGELQQFIYNRMTYQSLPMAGITAIATLTAFAQTHITIKSRDGLGLNEYYMVLAPTGFGKEDIRKPMEILDRKSEDAIKAGMGNMESVKIRHAAPASAQGIHQIMEENRSTCFLSDEFAEWLRLSHTDAQKQAGLGYLMQAYTKALGIIEPGHAVTRKYEPVEKPRLSIFATSTAEAMFSTLTRDQADSGAYNRWVMFAGDTELPPKRYTGQVYEPNQTLINFIAWVKEIKPRKEIKFTSAGLEAFIELDSNMAEPIKRKDGVLGGRLAEQAIKMAGLIALSDKRFQIEPSDLQAAFNIRIGLYQRAAALARHEGSLDGLHSTGQAMQQLVEQFEKRPSIYRSQLKSLSRRYAALSVNEQRAVVDALVSEGVVEVDPARRAVLVSKIHQAEALTI